MTHYQKYVFIIFQIAVTQPLYFKNGVRIEWINILLEHGNERESTKEKTPQGESVQRRETRQEMSKGETITQEPRTPFQPTSEISVRFRSITSSGVLLQINGNVEDDEDGRLLLELYHGSLIVTVKLNGK